jgi:hypothetical protein
LYASGVDDSVEHRERNVFFSVDTRRGAPRVVMRNCTSKVVLRRPFGDHMPSGKQPEVYDHYVVAVLEIPPDGSDQVFVSQLPLRFLTCFPHILDIERRVKRFENNIFPSRTQRRQLHSGIPIGNSRRNRLLRLKFPCPPHARLFYFHSTWTRWNAISRAGRARACSTRPPLRRSVPISERLAVPNE